MKIIGLFGLFFFFFSCQEVNLRTKYTHPVCIDSVDFESAQFAYDGIEEKLEYNFLYIGKEKDTIQINYRAGLSLAMGPIPPPPPPPPNWNVSDDVIVEDTIVENEASDKWRNEWEQYETYWCGMENCFGTYKHAAYDSLNLSIVVDLNHKVLAYDGLPIPSQSVAAYPVIIENLEKDTILLTTGRYIEMFLEGKKDGEWITLKEPARHRGCGMGLNYLCLLPNEIFITSLPAYQWKESQELRLRLGKQYSSPFKGEVLFKSLN